MVVNRMSDLRIIYKNNITKEDIDYQRMIGCDIVEVLLDYDRCDADYLMDLAAEEIKLLRIKIQNVNNSYGT